MRPDNVHNFLMEAHRISQEAQFIVDSLPNAEQPAVERDITWAMGVSRQTLYNHMDNAGRSTARREWTEISDVELDERVAEISLLHPFSGSAIISGHLEARSIHVPRKRVQDNLRRVDKFHSEGRAAIISEHCHCPHEYLHLDGINQRSRTSHIPTVKRMVSRFEIRLEIPVLLYPLEPAGICRQLSISYMAILPSCCRSCHRLRCLPPPGHCPALPAGSAPAAPMHAAAHEHIHHLTIPNRGALALRKRCPSDHPLSRPVVVYLGPLLTATWTLVGSRIIMLLGCSQAPTALRPLKAEANDNSGTTGADALILPRIITMPSGCLPGFRQRIRTCAPVTWDRKALCMNAARELPEDEIRTGRPAVMKRVLDAPRWCWKQEFNDSHAPGHNAGVPE
ncbi:hypothetical protein DFH08DRAFT_828236 [Mycena albidolilacea]|uniref:Uncharacterized protein n=1 Tax=Mycena albidolilacea TaxID=1033008 RepID=A0AAD7E6K5_9AGAR|nr:hypothetical protein DFH08DRAFT_828236 [Mycena albidolilacea]